MKPLLTTLTSQIPHDTWWESEVKTVSQAGHANIISSTSKISGVGKLRCETTIMLLTPPAATKVKWQHKPFLRIHFSRSSLSGGSNATPAISTVLRALELRNQINVYWTLRSPRKTLQECILLCTTCASVTDTLQGPSYIDSTYWHALF